MNIDRWIEGAPERAEREDERRIRAGEQAELEFDQGKEMSRRQDDARTIAELRQLLREARDDHSGPHHWRCYSAFAGYGRGPNDCVCGLADWDHRVSVALGAAEPKR